MFMKNILNQGDGSEKGKLGEGVGVVDTLGGSCPVVSNCSDTGVRARFFLRFLLLPSEGGEALVSRWPSLEEEEDLFLPEAGLSD